MLVVCLLALIVIAALLYCIAAAAARVCRSFRNRALAFLPPSAAAPFEDLLADGDLESTFRVLKALEQRGDVQVIESEKEVLIAAAGPLPPASLSRASVD